MAEIRSLLCAEVPVLLVQLTNKVSSLHFLSLPLNMITEKQTKTQPWICFCLLTTIRDLRAWVKVTPGMHGQRGAVAVYWEYVIVHRNWKWSVTRFKLGCWSLFRNTNKRLLKKKASCFPATLMESLLFSVVIKVLGFRESKVWWMSTWDLSVCLQISLVITSFTQLTPLIKSYKLFRGCRN